MRIDDLTREFEHADGRQRELSAQREKLDTQIKNLRVRRTGLLAPAGLGDEAAIEELQRTEQAIRDALRQQRDAAETGTEVFYHSQKVRWDLLRAIAAEEMGQLPKVASALSAALKPVTKAVANLDPTRVEAHARNFQGARIAQYKAAGSMIRAEIAGALASALAVAIEHPDITPDVSLAGVETIYRGVLDACDRAEAQRQQRMASTGMELLLERKKLEAGTAL